MKWAHFRDAKFSFGAIFEGAQFSDVPNFSNADFRGTTRFESARFEKYEPSFYGANLHPDITFSTPERSTDNWPSVPKIEGDKDERDEARSKIVSQKNAYTELRRHMASLHKVDEEQFFYRQEMACQRALEEAKGKKNRPVYLAYRVFDWLSDYGWSIKKPFSWLLGIWFTGWISIFIFLNLAGTHQKVYTDFFFSALFSAASTLPAFGARRELFEQLKVFGGEDWLTLGQLNAIGFVSMLQTGLGIFFLFLLLLAIRNRFRLR